MSLRVKISVFLILAGCFLAFFPAAKQDRFRVKPAQLAGWASSDSSAVTAEEVAKFLIAETPGITLIDVRDGSAFAECSLPGAVNIPLKELTVVEHRDLLGRKSGKNIFYSNGDELSTAALILAAGSGYRNCYRLTGGMNAWFTRVMNASFSGDRLSARENAILTNLFEAGRMFIRYNSLPDSLKSKLSAVRQMERKKLDGGCE
jgi:rhodanese-related sulfurtransferase